MHNFDLPRRNEGMDFETYKKVVGYDKWESVDDRFAVTAGP
jgi:hypothetical protein